MQPCFSKRMSRGGDREPAYMDDGGAARASLRTARPRRTVAAQWAYVCIYSSAPVPHGAVQPKPPPFPSLLFCVRAFTVLALLALFPLHLLSPILLLHHVAPRVPEHARNRSASGRTMWRLSACVHTRCMVRSRGHLHASAAADGRRQWRELPRTCL